MMTAKYNTFTINHPQLFCVHNVTLHLGGVTYARCVLTDPIVNIDLGPEAYHYLVTSSATRKQRKSCL